MTKQLLKVTPHSFVDVMTNSSSELFVCNSDKSVEQVKAIVERVMKGYWQMVGEPEQEIWGKIFEEPRVIRTGLTREQIATYNSLALTNADRNAIKEKVKTQFLMDNPEASEKQLLNAIWDAVVKEDTKHWDAQREYATKIGDVEGLIYYDVTYDKGDIMLHSADDNSIPYDAWGPLEDALGATRYHLG